MAQLPPKAAGFTGRDDELVVLTELLDPAQSADAVVVSAVAGLAGVGKTTLVVQAGHAAMQRGWFGGGVLFVDLHGYDDAPVEPEQALDALLRALGVPAERIPPGAENRAALYRSVLANIGDPVLVIADNASSEAQVRLLLPGTGKHKVVVTSRHTLAGLDARLLDVAVLNDPKSIALLDAALRVARPADDRIAGDYSDSERLATACGGLPLALQITAALLKADPTLGTGELADQLAVEHERLIRLRYDDGSGVAAPSVAAAFELSYQRLEKPCRRLFRLLSVNPGPDVSTAAAAILADLPVSEARELLSKLVHAHLAEPASLAGRWRMHDLLSLYARQLSHRLAEADGRDQVLDRLLLYYLEIADAASQHLYPPGLVSSKEFSTRDEALAWLDAERRNLIAATTISADTGRDQISMYLPNCLSQYLSWRRRYDDMLSITAVSRASAQRLGDQGNEALALMHHGIALEALRRFEEAITAFLGAAAIFREVGERYGQGMALNNLGGAYHQIRLFEEAITAHTKAVAIYREIGDRNREGGALDNLGSALRAVRRFEEALTAHQDAAAAFRETSDRQSLSNVLNNLGIALRYQRRIDEAISAHQEAVGIFREAGDNHGEALGLNNLGSALYYGQRFEEAIDAHQGAATIYRETADRHSEGGAITNLGLALQRVQHFDEAIAAHQDAATIYRETRDRHREGLAVNNLGSALLEAQRFEEALAVYEDASTIYQETGDRHGESGVLLNASIALRALQRFEEAINMGRDAVAIYSQTGDSHGRGVALDSLGTNLQ